MHKTFENLRDELKSNGCTFVRNFISISDIQKIKNDIEKWKTIDLEERQAARADYGRFHGSAGVTFYNQGKHIITDFFARSNSLDQAIDRLLSDESVSKLLEFIGGKNLKLRGYNARCMTGNPEYSAMEWHRDNIGEITIGIVMDDQGESSDGATCYVPGSHLYPYCPFMKAQFTMPYPIKNPP